MMVNILPICQIEIIQYCFVEYPLQSQVEIGKAKVDVVVLIPNEFKYKILV